MSSSAFRLDLDIACLNILENFPSFICGYTCFCFLKDTSFKKLHTSPVNNIEKLIRTSGIYI